MAGVVPAVGGPVVTDSNYIVNYEMWCFPRTENQLELKDPKEKKARKILILGRD